MNQRTFLAFIFVVAVSHWPLMVMADDVPASADSPQNLSTFKDQKDQEGYLYNLEDILKRSEKAVEKVDQKLEEQKLIEAQEMKILEIRSLYERGMALYEQGETSEAEDLWQQATQLTQDPELQAYFNGDIRTYERQDVALRRDKEELERQRILRGRKAFQIYQKAVESYNNHNYGQAREQFAAVEELSEDFLATRSYLMLIAKSTSPEDYAAMAKRFSTPTGEPTMLVSRGDVEKYIDQQQSQQVPAVVADVPSESSAVDSSVKASASEKKSFNLKGFFKNKEIDAEELEQEYQKAVKAYNRRQLEKAKDLFGDIDSKFPDYKDTRRYLAVIEQELGHEQRMASDEDYRRDVLKGELKEEAWRQDLELKSQEAQLTEEKKAQEAYSEARVLYDQGKLKEAREKFEFVDRTIPNYRQTVRFLTSIDQKLGKAASHRFVIVDVEEPPKPVIPVQPPITDVLPPVMPAVPVMQLSEDSRRKELDDLYQTGRFYHQTGNYEAAKQHFLMARKIDPKYEELPKYLKEIDQLEKRAKDDQAKAEKARLAEVRRQEEEVRKAEAEKLAEERKQQEQARKELERQLDEAYDQAVAAYKRKEYADARQKFESVQAMDSDYRATESYLKKIEQAVKEEELRSLDDQAKQFAAQLRQDRLSEKISSDKEDRITREMAKAQDKELQDLYAQGKSAYGRKDYAEAQSVFEEIYSKAGDYKSTERYLSKIASAMKKGEASKMTKAKASEGRIKVPSEEKMAKGLSPEVQDAIRRRREQMAAVIQDKYDQALTFYKMKNLQEAKYKFVQVEAMSPDYKETRNYLARLESETAKQPSPDLERSIELVKVQPAPEMKKAEKSSKASKIAMEQSAVSANAVEIKEAKASNKAAEIVEAQMEQPSQAVKMDMKPSEGSSEAEKVAQMQMAKADAVQKPIVKRKSIFERWFGRKESPEVVAAALPYDEAKVGAVYQEAVAAFDSGDYLNARDKFSEIVKVAPDYQKAQDYLKKADRKISDMEKQRLKEAKALAKQNKGVVSSESEVSPETDVAKIDAAKSITPEKPKVTYDEAKVEAVYQEAIVAFDKGDYLTAHDKFSAIKEVISDYKQTNDYLKKSNKLAAEREKQRLKEAKQLARQNKNVVSSEEPKKSFLSRFRKSSDEVQPMTDKEAAQNQRDVAQLKERISADDAEDAQRIAKLERRHQREKARQQGIAAERPAESKPGLMARLFDRKEREATLDQRRKDLDQLVSDRRKVLQEERAKIQKEFEKSLDDLYAKGVKLEKAGMTQQAQKIFVEIERLQPGYKDTPRRLAQISGGPLPQESAVRDMAMSGPVSVTSGRDDLVTATLDQMEKGL